MGVIFVRYRQQVQTWLIFDRKNPDVSVRYDLGTVFARVRGGATFSNLSAFQIFPKFGPRGGQSNINVFPNSK